LDAIFLKAFAWISKQVRDKQLYTVWICLLVETVAIISIEPAGERVQVRPQTGDGQPARLDLV
jgi:hypothetical protein